MIVSGELNHPGLARHQYYLIAQAAVHCAVKRHFKEEETITVWSVGNKPTVYYVRNDQEGIPPNAKRILRIRPEHGTGTHPRGRP